MRNNDHYTVSILREKYPQNAGELLQVYHDLVLAQRWDDVVAVDLQDAKRPALFGVRPDDSSNTSTASIVVPCRLDDTLSLEIMNTIFRSIEPSKLHIPSLNHISNDSAESGDSRDQRAFHGDFIYMAIASNDSTQVYYKLSKGIVKPQV